MSRCEGHEHWFINLTADNAHAFEYSRPLTASCVCVLCWKTQLHVRFGKVYETYSSKRNAISICVETLSFPEHHGHAIIIQLVSLCSCIFCFGKGSNHYEVHAGPEVKHVWLIGLFHL